MMTIRRSVLAVAILALPVASAATEDESKLKVHGYLTQAYAWADLGDDPDMLSWLEGSILGIEEEGTTDYRTLALQIRYDFDTKSSLVVQFDHERQGVSRLVEGRDDVELDWAFYSHRFKGGTSIRVGRMPLPWGIYNEIRDVGTLLPFFRPVEEVYAESDTFNESLDGVQLSRTFFNQGSWPLRIDVFGGQSSQETASTDSQGNRVRVEGISDRFGLRLRLATPVDGLAFGFGLIDETLSGGLLREGEETPNDRWIVSLEGDFERFTVRSEYMEQSAVFQQEMFGRTAFDNASFYVETTLKLKSDLELMAQFSDSDDSASILDDPAVNPQFVSEHPVQVSSGTDFAFGLRYLLRWNVIVRAEYHWREEAFPRFSQIRVTPRPDGRLSVSIPNGTGDANYGIVSLSVSF